MDPKQLGLVPVPAAAPMIGTSGALSERTRAIALLALLAVLLWLPFGIAIDANLAPLLAIAAGCALGGAVVVVTGSVIIRTAAPDKRLAGRLTQLWGAFLFGEGLLQLVWLVVESNIDNADFGTPWGELAVLASLALLALPALAIWRTRVHLNRAQDHLHPPRPAV
jgi:hypothetical protein